MTIIVLDGQGGGIGRAIISALLPLLPQGAQLLCVGTNAMATAAMLKAGAQRGATGENAVRWAAQNADILIAPIALVLKDSMMGEITGDMAASVGSSRATRILVPTERCGTHVAGAHGVSMQALVEDAARQAAYNAISSKAHLQQLGGDDAQAAYVHVPADTLATYRQWFPNWTDARIRAHYAQSTRGEKTDV